jgi:tetratricopeptide (TPR) repeat protein
VAFAAGGVAVVALLLGTIVSTLMFLRERDARTSEARLRKEAEMREEASRIALLVTQRRFEEADKQVVRMPLDRPSIEVATELRALGDWHAEKGRWSKAAERFAALLKVNQFDSPEITSLDQLKFAAALLEAGDRRGYEQWRQSTAAKFTTEMAPLPAPIIKACLLLPAQLVLLDRLSAVSEPDPRRGGNASGRRTTAGHGVVGSDVKILFGYRRGDFADPLQGKSPADNPPRLATCWLIEAMGAWRRKDYWFAMVPWTKGYALVQAGARNGLAPLTVRAEIFPGVGETDYLHAPWYDWAVADLLLREWDEMIGEAEQSVSSTKSHAPTLPELAIIRAAGEWHALRGQWSEALRCAQYCVQTNQQDSLDHATMDYVNAAVACLKLGDEKTYLRLREEMATRFKDAHDLTLRRTLEMGLFRPIDNRLSATFENFAAGLAGWSRKEANADWGMMLLSLHSYRKGDYTNSMDLIRQVLARGHDVAGVPNAGFSIILALCLNQQGNRSAALSELDRAESVIRTGFNLDYDVWYWRHWVLVRLLLQEARGSIPQSPPPQPHAAPH